MFSLRQFLFQLHWFFGITLGLILAFMGVTGAMMSFENEMMRAMSPHSQVEPAGRVALTPDRLIARIMEQHPDRTIASLQMPSDPQQSVVVALKRNPKAGETRNPRPYVDPYSGEVLGEATGADFFISVRALHRWLALPHETKGIGGYATGAATLALVFFALSGLYLRWPKKPLNWRSWLSVDFRLSGRAFWRNLHATAGGLLLVFYLVSALSGSWWAFSWYKDAVTALLTPPVTQAESKPKPKAATASEKEETASNEAPEPVSLDLAWAMFLEESKGDFDNVIITIPQPGKAARFRSLPKDTLHDRMTDEFMIQPATGKITKYSPFSDLKIGEQIILSMDPIHSGAIAGMPGRLVMMTAALSLPFFAVSGLVLYGRRRQTRRQARGIRLSAMPDAKPQFLVVYASQTGLAEKIARQTAVALIASGKATQIASIARIGAERLQQAAAEGTCILFVVSTYGEGDAPDMALAFQRKVMATTFDLSDLSYGLLALGDRNYSTFCAFGKRLEAWLGDCSAKPAFNSIEMDGNDPSAITTWNTSIGADSAELAMPALREDFACCHLEHRKILNPGSVGLPVYRVVLRTPSHLTWTAGDIAEIRIGKAGSSQEILREYSIASLPETQSMELIIRQVRRPDGQRGLGSGWLTEDLDIGAPVDIRIRENGNFHPQDHAAPAIYIGNGTGISGLHAHLLWRERQGHSDNRLFFGERNRVSDYLLGDRLDHWRSIGHLTRLDLAFSRDQQETIYVQHLLDRAADDIRDAVAREASIHVCGSLATMAPAVDAELRRILGDAVVDDLIVERRYLRDVY